MITTTLCIDLTLDSFEKISNIIIAVGTLGLGYYVFVYQKRKDESDRKIQWFKDLIIQPKLSEVHQFYEKLGLIKNEFKTTDLTDEEKIRIITMVKADASEFRKKFLSLIQFLTPSLFQNIMNNVDNLTDIITNAIGDDELKLCNENTYNREIGTYLEESYSFVLKKIFEYKGEQ